MSPIERIGIVFGSTLWVENRIRDFILLGENQEFIDTINSCKGAWHDQIQERFIEINQGSFNDPLVERFIRAYEKILTSEELDFYKKILNQIHGVRDTICHIYFSTNAGLFYHYPKDHLKVERLKKLNIEISDSPLVFHNFNEEYVSGIKGLVQMLDSIYFPELSRIIGLDYEKIR